MVCHHCVTTFQYNFNYPKYNIDLYGDVLELPEPDAPSSPSPSAEAIEVPLENPSIYTGRYLSDELE